MLHIFFSGRSIGCFDSGSEHFQLETVSDRSLEQMVPVLEKLGKNNSSRQWFFLWEPPWVLTFYERVIVLNREEIRVFALGRFLEGPKNSLEDEIETWDLEGPPVDESPHWVGAAYLEKNLHSTLGLLTVILDPKAQEFHALCGKNFPENNRTCSPDLLFAFESGTTAPGSNAFLQLRTMLLPAMGG